MYARMHSIKFNRRRTRQACVRWFSEFAVKSGFMQRKTLTRVIKGFTVKQLNAAGLKLLSQEEIDTLRNKGRFPMGGDQARVFSQACALDVFNFLTIDKKISVTVELASSNTYPTIGVYTWDSNTKGMGFVGGFFKIQASSLKDLKQTFLQIRKVLGYKGKVFWSRYV